MKKLIHIIAALLCLVMLLSACDGTTTPGSDSSTPDDSGSSSPADSSSSSGNSDTPSDSSSSSSGNSDTPGGSNTSGGSDGLLVKDGVSYYSIMRADDMEQTLLDAVVSFRTTLNSSYKTTMDISTDWSRDNKNGAVVENDAREILIGATNRRESVDTLAELEKGQYVVKWVGVKLVILGYNDYATRDALKAFAAKYVSSGNELYVPTDINITGSSSDPTDPPEGDADIRIMTYNLACSTKDLATRKNYIPESILSYMPDVVGCQECDKAVHTNALSSKELKKYYAINVQLHSNNKTYNYTPILYRKDLYTNVEAGVEFLDQRYMATNTKSLSWVVLERKSDGQRFIVINMHAAIWTSSYPIPDGETYDSMRVKAESWRSDNARQMLEKITELQKKYGNIPVFTTGDYNCNKTAAAYTAMKATGLSSSGETAQKISSGASYHSDVGSKPAASGLPIDHIFYYAELSYAYVYYIGTTQTDLNASDHCPVYADFKLVR